MRIVLVIDAAWTDKQPSGVAIARECSAGWCLGAVQPSYQHFHALAHGKSFDSRPAGFEPTASDLIAWAKAFYGPAPDLVAIDMPLSHCPIEGRRESDNKISRIYGARHCSTHTPSKARPGKISDTLRRGFDLAGYPLLTSAAAKPPGLIEVYPHPALVEFSRAPMRLKYKASKVRAYWPRQTLPERRCSLINEWRRIACGLDMRLHGVMDALPALQASATGVELKAYEDMLDAIVCVCVAISVLEGDADPFGDCQSAIWVPRPQEGSCAWPDLNWPDSGAIKDGLVV